MTMRSLQNDKTKQLNELEFQPSQAKGLSDYRRDLAMEISRAKDTGVTIPCLPMQENSHFPISVEKK